MQKDNYLYDQTDTVKTHKGKSKGSDVIKTYTQNFLLDVPESFRRIKAHVKLTVRDKKDLPPQILLR